MATRCCCPPELMRILVRVLQHAYLVQQRQRLAAQVHERAAPVVLRRQHHVLQHGLVREQVEALEHHADIQDARARRRAARRIQEGLAMQQHAPAVQRLQAVQGADQGRLARARRADDADDLARLDHQVDALEHLVVAETLARALDLQGLFRALRRRRLGEVGAQRVARALIQRQRPGRAAQDVQVRFEPAQQLVEDGDDQHVIERHRQHGLEHQEVLRVQPLAHQQDLGQRDHRHQRGQLGDGDELVAQRRQRDAQRLRDHDHALDARIADAQRAAGLDLAARHAQDAATMNLGDEGGLAQHQRREPGVERIGQHRARRGNTCGRL